MEDVDGDVVPLDVPQNRHNSDKDRVSDDTDSNPGSSVAEDLDTGVPEFYDPDIDDQDAEWIAKQRQGRKSDAILSCPCCLTTLCIDCQQHAELESQFRAMFVMNCRVVPDKPVKVVSTVRRKKRNRNSSLRSRGEDEEGPEPEKPCSSVVCEVCDTEVGARDSEEVYHFFHVLATNA
eukprot:jgi/Botrbrau1/22250/Bobra.0138s0012.1